jgi:hypothetical protein
MSEYRHSLGLARQWSAWFLISSPKDETEAKQIRQESEECVLTGERMRAPVRVPVQCEYKCE